MASILEERIEHAPGADEATAQIAARLRAATVEVRVDGHGNGSGVVWGRDGLIVTNNHVAPGNSAAVILADGRTLQGKVVDRSEEYDLAAVRVDAVTMEAATIGDSSKLRVGQLVLAMGHPLGVKDALTMGIVHMAPSSRSDSREHRWIHADLSLLPGNSGGPMADAHGSVIGINSMVAGGLALAVPSNTVARFVAGTIRPAFLGVQTQVVALPASMTARFGLGQESGLMILSVVPGGPAARNGLLPGDILIAAAKWPLTGHDALISILRRGEAGTPLPLLVIRGGVLIDVTAILGERDTKAA